MRGFYWRAALILSASLAQQFFALSPWAAI
jgi:hypothetical protein